MDIIYMGLFLGFALTVIGFDFYKQTLYMGVLGGVMLVIMGALLAGGVTVTESFCAYNTNTTAIGCVDHVIADPGNPQSGGWALHGLGALLMFAGVGVALDAYFRYGDDAAKSFIKP